MDQQGKHVGAGERFSILTESGTGPSSFSSCFRFCEPAACAFGETPFLSGPGVAAGGVGVVGPVAEAGAGAGAGVAVEAAGAGVVEVAARAGVLVSVLASLGLPLLPPFLLFLRRDCFFSSASLRLLSATSSHGFSPREIFSSKTLWFSGLHCSQKYSSGSSPFAKVRPMQSLCCQAEHRSQQIMSRSTSSSSSYSPHMHRMISSSSLGAGVGSAEGLAGLSLAWALVFDFFGVSGTRSRFLCWPLVERPERRGSSAVLVSFVIQLEVEAGPKSPLHFLKDGTRACLRWA